MTIIASASYGGLGTKGEAIRMRLLSRLWNSTLGDRFPPFSTDSIALPLVHPRDLWQKDLWQKDLERTWTALLLTLVLVLAALYAGYCVLRLSLSQGSSKQTNSLWQLSDQLNEESNLSYGEVELESDEYEAEAEKRSLSYTGHRARAGLRRLVGRESHVLAKRSSVIRITSSDPTSNLCDNPLQVELDTPRRGLVAASPFAGPTASTHAAPILEGSGSSARRSAANGSPAPGRRRRESGRLVAAAAKNHTAGPSSIRSSSVDSTRSARSKQTSEKTLSSPLLRTVSRVPPTCGEDGDSLDAKTAKDDSAHDDGWTDDVTAEEDGDVEQHDVASPSLASNHSFVSASSGKGIGLQGNGATSVPPSPSSSTAPLPLRLPSILKREPQTFRSGLLSQIDISYSLIQRSASLANLQSPTGQMLSPEMAPGIAAGVGAEASGFPTAGYMLAGAPPPYSATSGGLNPSLSQAYSLPWTRRSRREVRLTEPDWTEHADTHDRARERLEAAAMVASRRRASSLDASMLPGGHQLTGLGAGMAGLGFGGGAWADAEEFWFERLTQSTAAAGRDWDWRKRRARSARLAAMHGSTVATGSDVHPSPVDRQAAAPGNVGKTDVQLQKKQGSAVAGTGMAAGRKQMPVAPLISFDQDELPQRPSLSSDARDVEELSSWRSEGSGLPSPFGQRRGSFASLGFTSEAQADKPRRHEGEALDELSSLPLASSAGTGTLNTAIASGMDPSRPLIKKSSVSATASLKRGVGKMMRRRTSTSDAVTSDDSLGLTLIPSASMSAESLLDARRSTDLDFDAPDSAWRQRGGSETAQPSTWKLLGGTMSNASSSSLGVPNRFSSLAARGRKMSLSELRGSRRASSSQVDLSRDSSGVELIGPDEVPVGTSEAERDAYAGILDSPEDNAGPRSSADAYGSASLAERTAAPLDHELSESRLARRTSRPSSSETARAVPTSALNPTTASLAKEAAPVVRLDARSNRSGSIGSSDSSGSARRRSNGSHLSRIAEPHEGLRIDVSPAKLKRYQMAAEQTVASPTLLSPMSRGSDSSSVSAQLASASSSSPPVTKVKVRSGNRSSILKSAGGARNDLDRTSSRARRNSRTGSIGSSSMGSLKRVSSKPKLARDAAPNPSMQPEPAPMGMAARARSASISSNGSRSSRRDTIGALTGMSSTASSRIGSGQNTPDALLADHIDPLGMTPLSPSFSENSLSSIVHSPALESDLKRSSSGKLVSRRPSSPPPAIPLPSLPVPDRTDDSVKDVIARGERIQRERRSRSGSNSAVRGGGIRASSSSLAEKMSSSVSSPTVSVAGAESLPMPKSPRRASNFVVDARAEGMVSPRRSSRPRSASSAIAT